MIFDVVPNLWLHMYTRPSEPMARIGKIRSGIDIEINRFECSSQKDLF